MSDRWELVELIGQRALDIQDVNLLRQTAEAILDAVEPMIRADEREQKFHDMDGLGMDLLRARKRLADLRDEVQRLRDGAEADVKLAADQGFKGSANRNNGEKEAYERVLRWLERNSG